MAYRLADLLSSPPPRSPEIKSARSQNRAAAWAYDLALWREYRLAMAKTDAADIEAEYAKRLDEGPDFAGYHASSTYEPPPVNAMDVAGKREILVAFDQVRAWLWRNGRKKRGQAVSKTYREVLAVLCSFAVKFGAVYPSQATIARLACCSERTVANALQWLKMYGFLTWLRRLRRVPSGRLGMVVRQTSNAYRVSIAGIAVLLARAGRNNCNPSGLTPNRPMQLGVPRESGAG